MASHGISDRELQDLFIGDTGKSKDPSKPDTATGLKAQHIALILDACHSGQVLEADEWRTGPMNSRSLAQLAWEKGIEVITASQSNQYAKELKNLQHGPLTYYLLNGFNEAPRKDGGLAFLSLHMQITPATIS